MTSISSPTTILLVEDEKPLQVAITEKLKNSGFTVLIASDGREGLEMALSHKPDLILLDIIMPVMDGISMLKKLREDEWGRDVPVVVLTNLSDAQKLEETTQSEALDYLIKSDWRLEDVVDKVESMLRKD